MWALGREFPPGAHAQLFGLVAKPELNDLYVVSRGVNPENAERLTVATATGGTLSIRPANLRPAELLPGSRVAIVGLEGAAVQELNGQHGEVLSSDRDRWIVEVGNNKERKSLRSLNLVLLSAAVPANNKRQAEQTADDSIRPRRRRTGVGAASLEDFPSGTPAQLFGLVAQPELNDVYVVSRGVNPQER